MASTGSPERYRFGPFELQLDERRLLRDGATVPLRPLAFDVLTVMVERGGRLISKDELHKRVWGKVIVEDNTLQAHITVLRKTLGHDAIATISGSGYRFALAVTPTEASATPTSPTRSTRSPRQNLPHQLTSFIGREKQLAELEQLLSATRLLTLTGAGGCGKTRLALELAREVIDRYGDGVLLVELAALKSGSGDLVARAVADALELQEQGRGSLVDAIVERLAAGQLLLVLDNAEHLLDASARLTDELLRRCAGLTILVTSREHLRVAGELTYRVPSLALPDENATPEALSTIESARLFVDRARLQESHFEIAPSNAAAVVAICRRLDGIALAIELAAPRLRSMTIEELQRRLDDRFQLLTGGTRTALPRQQTLRSLIDWSYDLLSGPERQVLQRVSVFAGGWTLQAAEQVCGEGEIEKGAVLDLLSSLVDKSLIVAETKRGETRYGILETVSHYARDRLRESGGEEHAQRRHLAHLVGLATELERLPMAADQPSLRRLDAERDNVRAALSRCIAPGSDATSGLRLAGALSWFWLVRGNVAEGRGWYSALLAAAPADLDPATRVTALRGLGRIAWEQDDYAAARAVCLEGLAICKELGNRAVEAQLLSGLGAIAVDQSDYEAAQPFHEEALAIRREIDDRHGIFSSLIHLGDLAARRGAHGAGRELLEQGLAISRGLGVAQTSEALRYLGFATLREGDYAVARKLFEQSLTIQRDLGIRRGIAGSLVALGNLACVEGDYQTARRFLEEALGMEREQGGRASDQIDILECLGALALARAGPVPAAVIWGGAEQRGQRQSAFPRDWYDRQVAAARAALGDDAAFDQAWQRGRTMSFEQLAQYALDIESPS